MRINPGQVYVTPNSFLPPAVDDTGAIQRGVNLALSGETVNVQAGSYPISSLNFTQAVTLSGAFAGVTGTNGSRGTGESILVGPADQTQGASPSTRPLPSPSTASSSTGRIFSTPNPMEATSQFLNNVLNLQAIAAAKQNNMIFSNTEEDPTDRQQFTTTGYNPANAAVLQVAGNYAGGADTTNFMDVTGNTFIGVPVFTPANNSTNGAATLQLNFSSVQGNVQNNIFDSVDIGI